MGEYNNRKTTSVAGIAQLLLVATGLATLALASPIASAQAQSNERPTYDFDIAAQPLLEALREYSVVTGRQVVVPRGDVRRYRSSAVTGTYTAEAALSRLVANTGLAVEFLDEETFSLRLPDTAPPQTDIADELDVEEIIVRGQRVRRTVFETPTSVSAFLPEDFERIPGAQSLDDLLARIPNVSESGDSGGGVIIRGVTSSGVLRGGLAATGGARPRASTIVDGRVQDFQEYVYGGTSLYDIEQVEVFRGPQTTAQGVNSIAGALFVFTQDPTYDYEFGGLAEVSEFDSFQFAGHASGPLLEDELAFRVTADFRLRDNFLNYDEGAVTGDDQDPNPSEIQELVIRGKFLWEPNALPGFSAKLTLSHTDNYRPSNDWVVEPYAERRARDSSAIGRAASETGFAIADLAYEFRPGLSLSNQFSFSDYETTLQNPAAPPTVRYDGEQLSNETILILDPDGSALSGLLGVYYWGQEQTDDIRIFNGIIDDEQSSLGAFGQSTWRFAERWSVTAGLRYQRDAQERRGELAFGPFAAVVDYDETFDAWLPKVELSYDLNDAARVGVTASRGFNPGGLTVNFFTGLENRFEEETVWTYDAFFRSSLAGGRVSFNGNVFYSDYDGFQKFSVVGFSPIDAAPIVEIDNVDTARTYGIELSTDVVVNTYVSVFATLGVLETTFDNLVSPGVEDEFELANAPGFTAFIGADLQPLTDLTLSVQLRYSDSFFSDDDNTPLLRNDSYTMLDLSARYSMNRATLYAYWENVTDELYTTRQFLQAGELRAAIGPSSRAGIGVAIAF